MIDAVLTRQSGVHRDVSPNQIVWNAISGTCVVGDIGLYYGVLIALTNARRSRRRHELITSGAANDRNLATPQPLTDRVICRYETYLIIIDEIVSLVRLCPR